MPENQINIKSGLGADKEGGSTPSIACYSLDDRSLYGRTFHPREHRCFHGIVDACGAGLATVGQHVVLVLSGQEGK